MIPLATGWCYRHGQIIYPWLGVKPFTLDTAGQWHWDGDNHTRTLKIIVKCWKARDALFALEEAIGHKDLIGPLKDHRLELIVQLAMESRNGYNMEPC